MAAAEYLAFHGDSKMALVRRSSAEENSNADEHDVARVSDVVPKQAREPHADTDSISDAISDAINAITIPPAALTPTAPIDPSPWSAGEVTVTKQVDAALGMNAATPTAGVPAPTAKSIGEDTLPRASVLVPPLAPRGMLPRVRTPQPRAGSSSSLPIPTPLPAPAPPQDPPTLARSFSFARAETAESSLEDSLPTASARTFSFPQIFPPLPDTDPETLARRPADSSTKAFADFDDTNEDREDREDEESDTTYPKHAKYAKHATTHTISNDTEATMLRRDAIAPPALLSLPLPPPPSPPSPSPRPSAHVPIQEPDDNATRVAQLVAPIPSNVTLLQPTTPSSPMPMPMVPAVQTQPQQPPQGQGHQQAPTWIPYPQRASAATQWPAHRVALIISVTLLAVAILVLAIRPRTQQQQPQQQAAESPSIALTPVPVAVDAPPASPPPVTPVPMIAAPPTPAKTASPVVAVPARKVTVRSGRSVIPVRREQ